MTIRFINDPAVASVAKPKSRIRFIDEPVPQKSVSEFVLEKAPESIAGVAGAVVRPITHPVETAKGLGKLALGVASRALPGVQKYEPYADALGDMLLERYGSLKRVKDTMYNDPAGFAMDVSTVLPALSGIAMAAKMPKTAGVISKVAGATNLPHQATRPAFALGAKLAGKTGLDVREKLIKALRPGGIAKKEYIANIDTAVPEIRAAAEKTGKSIDNVDDLLAVTKEAKKNVWSRWEELFKKGQAGGKGTPSGSPTIDGNKIADEMVKAIDSRMLIQNPKGAAKIEKVADTYRRPINLKEAEEYLESVNNQLHGHYAKMPPGRRIDYRDPEIGYVIREGDALKKELYGKLDELTGANSGAIKKSYGALMSIENAATKRAVVSARLSPFSLQEQINFPFAAAKAVKSALTGDITGGAEAMAQIAISRGMKKAGTTDALIKKAFKPTGRNLMPAITKARKAASIGMFQAGRATTIPPLRRK